MVADDLDTGVAGTGVVAHRKVGARSTFLENIMPEVEVWTTVDVELDDFADEDLLDEIERRGLGAEVPDTPSTELINAIYHKRRLGNDYQTELEQLIYQSIGRIV
jgi:hypothetical protein